MDGSIAPVGCVDTPEVYPRSSYCATRDVWTKVKDAISNVLDSITLENLMEQQLNKERTLNKAGDNRNAGLPTPCSDINKRK